MKTTVAIPLHRSAAWVDVVAGNVERLRGVAQVVVSDPIEADDSLARLRARFRAGEIEFFGERELPTGWAAHCNDLLERARTPYLMWLSHDDEIDPDWIEEGARALDQHPAAVLAVGSVAEDPDGTEMPYNPAYADPEPRDRVAAGLSDFATGHASSLGLLFRAVLRRKATIPLPAGVPWADVPWALGMLAQGEAIAIPAVYRKRWHSGSASASWPAHSATPDLRARDIRRALEPLGPEMGELLARAWADEVEQMHGHHEHLERQVADLTASLAALRARPAARIAVALRTAAAEARRRLRS